MSWKSLRFSLYSVLSMAGVMLGLIFLAKVNFLFLLLGIVLLFIPAKLQRIALDEASGAVDKLIAKFVVPALAILIVFLTIMSLAVWIK